MGHRSGSASVVMVVGILVFTDCSSDGVEARSSDAGVDAEAGDARASDAEGGGAEAGDAEAGDGSGLAERCGATPGGAWQRCALNPLVRGMRPFAGGGIQWTAADPTVLWDPEERLWKAWWSTVVVRDCRDLSDRVLHVMYAQSVDGLTWTYQDEPALVGHRDPADWDHTTTETPTVIRVANAPPNRRFAMVYAGGNDAALMVAGFTGWQLGLAFSSDGRRFTRLPAAESPYAGRSTPFRAIEGLVLLGEDVFPTLARPVEAMIADPELLEHNGTFHLYFSSYGKGADGEVRYGISHATSTDLVRWTPRAENPIPALVGGGQPTIVQSESGGDELTMWFGQENPGDTDGIPSIVFPTRGFWKATSSDGGRTWARAGATRDFVWDPTEPAENLGLINGAAAVRGPDGLLRLYYAGWGTKDAPPGSCVYVRGASGTDIVEGVFGINLAVQ